MAAELRDRIEFLRQIQEQQRVESGDNNADAWVLLHDQATLCVQRLTFRQGRLTNSQSFFPGNPAGDEDDELLVGFLEQFYLNDHSGDGAPDLLVADFETDLTA